MKPKEKEKPKLTEVIDSNMFSLHFRPDGVTELWTTEAVPAISPFIGVISSDCSKREALVSLLYLLTPTILALKLEVENLKAEVEYLGENNKEADERITDLKERNEEFEKALNEMETEVEELKTEISDREDPNTRSQ